MASVEGAVVQPNVSLDGYASIGQSSIERDISPVIVVGVNLFLSSKSAGRAGNALTRLTGTMPRVRSVGYWYKSLPCVLSRIFCRELEISKLGSA